MFRFDHSDRNGALKPSDDLKIQCDLSKTQLLDAGHKAAKYYKMLIDYGDDGGMSALRFSWGRDVG